MFHAHNAAKYRYGLNSLFLAVKITLMKNLLFLIILFGFSLGFVNAQTIKPSPKVNKIGIEKGYKEGNTIAYIKEDRDHLIWIINFSGVDYYDGNEFRTVLSSNVNKGLLIRFIENYRGEKFVLDQLGQLFYIESDTLRPHPFNDTIVKLNKRGLIFEVRFDEKGTIHYTLPKQAYITIDSSGKVSYPLINLKETIHGVASIFRQGELPFVVFDRDRTVSDTSLGRFFYIFNERMELIEKYPFHKPEVIYPHSCIQLSNNNYLISTHEFLIEFNEEGVVREIPYESYITGLLLDQQNDLWISTPKGIHYYKSGLIEKGNRQVFMKGQFVIVREEDFQGGIWIHSDQEGLNRISHPRQVQYNKENGVLSSNEVTSLELNGDKLFYSLSGDKVVSLNRKTNEKTLLNPPINDSTKHIIDLYFDSLNKRLWVSQRGNLVYSDGNEWKKRSIFNLELRNHHSKYYLRGSAPFEKGLTVGYHMNQFFYGSDTSIDYVSPEYERKVISVLKLGDSVLVGTLGGLFLQVRDSVIDLKEQYPILKNIVHHCVYFNDQIWLSIYSKGVFRLTNKGLIPLKYNGEAIKNADIVLQNREKLWCITDYLNFLVEIDSTEKSLNGTKISAYPPLPKFNINDLISDDSSLFLSNFGTGILEVRFEDVKRSRIIPPHLVIRTIRIDDRELNLGDSIYELDSKDKFIQVSYLGVNFSDKDVAYRYRMLGVFDEWKKTDKNELQFIGLSAGDYTFEIQASLWKQPWSESKKIRFNIAPPFWQTAWFILLVSTFIFTIIYYAISYRFKIVRWEQKLVVDRLRAEQKALRAQMSPHFVFNIISSIQYLIEYETKEKASRFLDLFAASMRNILTQANENYITIGNEIQFLTNFIEMERFRLEDHFQFKIEKNILESKIDDLIPPFIVQPIVENAIQYGLKNKKESGLLLIRFEPSGDYLKVIIEDNGLGREQAKLVVQKNKAKSYAIRLIQERLELHNKKKKNLAIEDLKDEKNKPTGTRVTIYIRTIPKTKKSLIK